MPARRRPRPGLPFPLDPRVDLQPSEIHLLYPEPVDHVVSFGELFRIAEEIRRQAPGVPVRAWLRSQLRDSSAFSLLPVDAVEEIPVEPDSRLLELLARPESACVLLGAPGSWGARLREQPGVRLLGRALLGWRVRAAESPEARVAGQAFFRSLVRESPSWTAAPGPALPGLDRGGPHRFLVHQSRSHVGDTLWVTPLLRAIRRFFPAAHTTVVGPPVARELLAGLPRVEVVPYRRSEGVEAQRSVLGHLAGRRFDAALFAFTRWRGCRWLPRAMAAAGVPRRINLEYFDPSLDRTIPPWLTHEGWFFWAALPSPRMLLHALDPLLGDEKPSWTGEDRRVEVHVSPEARRRADELLAERGIGNEPFAVLAPGGHSSRLWPSERFARLAMGLAVELGLHVLVEGSAAEKRLLEEVTAGAAGPVRRRILAAADPLGVFVPLLERARLLVANDSAPIHLAEAAGTPTLYFAQREKLVHSHPAGAACWALYDEIENDPASISVRQALEAARAITAISSAGRR